MLSISFRLQFLLIPLTAVQLFTTPSLAGAEGPGKGGGGNIVRTQDDRTIPLDLYFAKAIKPIKPEIEFPEAFSHYKELLVKIRKAIPAVAQTINDRFSELNWIVAEHFDKTGCLNNLGIYRLGRGEKQEIVACQRATTVTLDKNAVQNLNLQSPYLLGEVFLHEAMVHWIRLEMMSDSYTSHPSRRDEWYAKYENALITKFMPFVLTNQNLAPIELYYQLFPMGLMNNEDTVAENGVFKLLIEVDPQMRTDYERFKMVEAQVLKLDELLEQTFTDYHHLRNSFLECKEGDPNLNTQLAFQTSINATRHLANNVAPQTERTINTYRERASYYPNNVIQRAFNRRADTLEKNREARVTDVQNYQVNLEKVLVPFCHRKIFGY